MDTVLILCITMQRGMGNQDNVEAPRRHDGVKPIRSRLHVRCFVPYISRNISSVMTRLASVSITGDSIGNMEGRMTRRPRSRFELGIARGLKIAGPGLSGHEWLHLAQGLSLLTSLFRTTAEHILRAKLYRHCVLKMIQRNLGRIGNGEEHSEGSE